MFTMKLFTMTLLHSRWTKISDQSFCCPPVDTDYSLLIIEYTAKAGRMTRLIREHMPDYAHILGGCQIVIL